MRFRADRRLEEIEALYERRFAHFVRVAQAIVGDRERATEAVQDAFADVIRSRVSFRGEVRWRHGYGVPSSTRRGKLSVVRWPRLAPMSQSRMSYRRCSGSSRRS